MTFERDRACTLRLCRLIQLATLPLDNMYGSDKIILKKAQSHI
jgi:hypothetical protein